MKSLALLISEMLCKYYNVNYNNISFSTKKYLYKKFVNKINIMTNDMYLFGN